MELLFCRFCLVFFCFVPGLMEIQFFFLFFFFLYKFTRSTRRRELIVDIDGDI